MTARYVFQGITGNKGLIAPFYPIAIKAKKSLMLLD